MAQSPFWKQVHAPIRDLEQFSKDIREFRNELDNGENNKNAHEQLTDIAETLLDQCDFLEEKLNIKVKDLKRLQSENARLRKRIEDFQAKDISPETMVAEHENSQTGTG